MEGDRELQENQLGMSPGTAPDGRPKGLDWPECAHLGNVCLLIPMGESIGDNIRDSLIAFILNGEKGSRLTLQRNQEGFTLQVTGPVVRTSKPSGDLARLKELMRQ